MEEARYVVGPHDLAGFTLNFYTALVTCSQISCPVVVEERLAMFKGSTTSQPTVTVPDEYDMLGCVTYVCVFIQGQTECCTPFLSLF